MRWVVNYLGEQMEGFYSTQTPGKLESGFKEGKRKNEREQMEPQVRWELSRGCCRSIVFARYRRCDSDSEFAMLAYSIMLWLWSDAQFCCAGSPSPKDRNSQLSLININAVVISVAHAVGTHPHRTACHPTDWILNFRAKPLPPKMIGIANWIS
jgi:hypothetical protein